MEIIAKQSDSDHKFVDPLFTADGSPRASVALDALRTLWFNTGTLCNLACENCYIESSPSNDALVYLTRVEAASYLAEIEAQQLAVSEIGITGGEPFMNPDILGILEDSLAAGLSVLVLTNAMRPMLKCADGLLSLHQRYPGKLNLRVSIDHYDQQFHEQERGAKSWQPMLKGMTWLAQHDFQLTVAGRTRWGDDETLLRQGFSELFSQLGVRVNAQDPGALLLFPEMAEDEDVTEITSACWSILGVNPKDMMCASSRMIVKHKGAALPAVVACTLLPYDEQFAFGTELADSLQPVALNHRHCSRFCVLGGGSCSG